MLTLLLRWQNKEQKENKSEDEEEDGNKVDPQPVPKSTTSEAGY